MAVSEMKDSAYILGAARHPTLFWISGFLAGLGSALLVFVLAGYLW